MFSPASSSLFKLALSTDRIYWKEKTKKKQSLCHHYFWTMIHRAAFRQCSSPGPRIRITKDKTLLEKTTGTSLHIWTAVWTFCSTDKFLNFTNKQIWWGMTVYSWTWSLTPSGAPEFHSDWQHQAGLQKKSEFPRLSMRHPETLVLEVHLSSHPDGTDAEEVRQTTSQTPQQHHKTPRGQLLRGIPTLFD